MMGKRILCRAVWLRRGARAALSAVLFAAGVAYAPYLWCSRQAAGWYRGDRELIVALARDVDARVHAPLARGSFSTGSDQFNGEWLFGTYMMAGMGFGQVALSHAGERVRCLRGLDTCIEQLLTPEVRAFDADMWGSDPIEDLGSRSDHAAFLGYFNLLLSLDRFIRPDSAHAELNDRITAHLVERLAASPISLLESYPREVYPVDNCAVIGSIGLRARAMGQAPGPFIEDWVHRLRTTYTDPASGLLYQCVDPDTGEALDEARGSGTCLGLYFLSFADREASADLYRAVRARLVRRVCGFGGVREYAGAGCSGPADIDSGPVVMGFGLSPTGFLLAGSRIHGDPDGFAWLFATAYAWGAPCAYADRVTFVTGGPLGNAILLAMLTAGAPPADADRPERNW